MQSLLKYLLELIERIQSYLIDMSYFDNESHRSRSRSRERVRRGDQISLDEFNDSDDDEVVYHVNPNRNKGDSTQPEGIGTQLSLSLLDFFQEVGQRRGFVMLPNQRTELKEEQQKLARKNANHHYIDWTEKAAWDIEQQNYRINQIFQSEALPLTEQQLLSLKLIFRQVSPLFGTETTYELYELFIQVLRHCLLHREESQERVKNFMVNQLKDSRNYKFFNFKFSMKAKFKLKGNKDAVYYKLGSSLHRQFTLALYGKN